jgi:glycosyltransferase involved in cell wall biosynthesis
MYVRAERLIVGFLGQRSDGSAHTASPDEPILLHAHDWLAHFCAAPLKHRYQIPLVATIHATEYGRNNGIHTPIQKYINHIEWNLQFEAWRLIVCTEFMKRECEHALGTPWAKMDVIYNGVDPAKFELPGFGGEEKAAFRNRYAAPYEKLIFFVGRMVREKGVQVLIDAMPKVRANYTNAKLIVVGGGNRAHLVEQAAAVGLSEQILFTGFVPDEDLLKIFQVIDIACFPSLYEPFGIVALEAMAANVPVVVSDAGGLPEVVKHGVTGITTYAGNPNSLADGLLTILKDPAAGRVMAQAAYQDVLTIFNWDVIAAQTRAVYDRVWAEYRESGWAFPPVSSAVQEPASVSDGNAASAADGTAPNAVSAADGTAPNAVSAADGTAPNAESAADGTAPNAESAADGTAPDWDAPAAKPARKPRKKAAAD